MIPKALKFATLHYMYADLPRLAHTRAMAAFAPALTPMLATPPARVFAPAEVLVLVVLLLHFCSEPLFSLCSGRSRWMRSYDSPSNFKV